MTDLAHRMRAFEVETDLHFVRRAWASEMRRAAFSRHVPQAVYWPCQHELVGQLLAAGTTIVACDPADPAHVYGYVVHQPGPRAIVHWVYVKGAYRRMGVGAALMAAAVGERRPILCTQASELFNLRTLVEKHELIYCPYLLLGIVPDLQQTGEPECQQTA